MKTIEFQRWLEDRGVHMTYTYCRAMTQQKLSPGPKFKQVFKEITGVTLVDGLIEQ